jgi:NitT/TauT family transport system substrate-binding protein
MGLSHPAFFCSNSEMHPASPHPAIPVSPQTRPRFFVLSVPYVLLVLSLCLVAGCKPANPSPENAPFEIILQTDWFPQPEHGGFYQALAKGYYEEAGLAVTILPGGPNSMSTQKVLKGRAHFAMNRADTIHSLKLRDVPVVMVMATLQHDPQALMLHAENPIDSFAELDGHQVMAIPGLAWIRWIEATYGIELEIIPHDFGMERFINDPGFIQQCLLTNEPFYVRQAGVEPKVLPLRESGFDPYHGIYCLKAFAESHPDKVRSFVQASVRGWRDYILNDPAPALDLIAARNPKMTPDFMAFSYQTLKQMNLVTGDGPGGRDVGSLDPKRMDAMVAELKRLGLAGDSGQPDPQWYTTRYLVTPADAPVDALP